MPDFYNRSDEAGMPEFILQQIRFVGLSDSVDRKWEKRSLF